MSGQPRGIYLLIATQMWERFSYYGMRTLLVLFMIESMELSRMEAIGIYALFSTLMNLGGVAGGFLADRLFGLRRAVYLGGSTMGIGHICLSLEQSHFVFYLGLSLIVVGAALFGVNVKALMGQLYGEEDPRRQAGYTLFYSGINLGGFLAAVSCGWAAQTYGWGAGFGLAAIGMFAGLLLLVFCRNVLRGKGSPPEGIRKSAQGIMAAAVVAAAFPFSLLIHEHDAALPLLPFAGLFLIAISLIPILRQNPRAHLPTMASLIALYVVFFLAEEWMGSVLMLFSQHRVDRWLGGWEVPSSSLIAVNPLVVILLGPLMAGFMERWRGGNERNSAFQMNGMAFLFLGVAFGILYFRAQGGESGRLIPLMDVIACFSLIAVGELFIAPTLYAYCSASSPPALKGLMMGWVVMGRSYASLLSGMLGKAAVADSGGEVFLFGATAWVALVLSGILVLGCVAFKGAPQRSVP